jgi:hypothetical protein
MPPALLLLLSALSVAMRAVAVVRARAPSCAPWWQGGLLPRLRLHTRLLRLPCLCGQLSLLAPTPTAATAVVRV